MIGDESGQRGAWIAVVATVKELDPGWANRAPTGTEAICKAIRKLGDSQHEAAAYKWAYKYLQSRLRDLGREEWARDCDSEIAFRIGEHS